MLPCEAFEMTGNILEKSYIVFHGINFHTLMSIIIEIHVIATSARDYLWFLLTAVYPVYLVVRNRVKTLLKSR